MKKHLLAIALFALCTTGLNAASPKKVAPEKKGVETINRATAEAHIGFLACDELEGREAGWKGGRIAGNYIISCLKQMGIKPLDGDYIQISVFRYSLCDCASLLSHILKSSV